MKNIESLICVGTRNSLQMLNWDQNLQWSKLWESQFFFLFCLEEMVVRAREMAYLLRVFIALQRTWILFVEPIQQLKTLSTSNSKKSVTGFWTPDTNVAHVLTCRWNTHIHKTNKKKPSVLNKNNKYLYSLYDSTFSNYEIFFKTV